MAINDESFYTVTGEEISRTILLEQMINFYYLLLDAGETQVTDFNEGSEIRNLLESIAVDTYACMENQNDLLSIGFVDTAEGEFLDMHGANPLINLERDTGSEASGYVTFKVEEAVTSDTVIPEGTIVVNSETGLEYTTLYDTYMVAGDSEVLVSIECLTTGEDGNCDAGTIDTIDSIDADIDGLSVINEEDITDGTDYEEDEEYRERLLAYKQKDDFGSYNYYVNLCSDVDGVHDIALIDDIDEVYTKIVLVNGDVKPVPDSVLVNVTSEYSDTTKHVIGHSFNVIAPDYVLVDITLDLDVSVEIDEDILNELITVVVDGGDMVLSAPFISEGLYIADDLSKEMLSDNILLIDGVNSVDLTFTVDSVEVETVETADNEVVQVNTVTINQTVEE